jgi:hypothetical protein
MVPLGSHYSYLPLADGPLSSLPLAATPTPEP